MILTANIGLPISYGATQPETACQEEKGLMETAYQMNSWKNATTKDQRAYKASFEEMQNAFHNYVGCMFDFAEKKVLKSDVDWMSPEQACLTSQEIKNIIEASEPKQMMTPILQAHSDYRTHLKKLATEFGGKGTMTDESGKESGGLHALRLKAEEYGRLERQLNLEIESSLLAIDLMFASLKELRLAFVMHVHFQCTLQYLDKYRRALEDLRKVIQPLPDKLKDASIS